MLVLDKQKKQAILKACKIIKDSVGATMGMGGRLVMYHRDGSSYPSTTKDGVSVANMISSPEKDVNMVISMIRQACHRQVENVGDGTTLTAILACKILEEGLKIKRLNVTKFRNELAEDRDNIIHDLNLQRAINPDKFKLIDIATIALNGDFEMAKIVVEAIEKSGDYGLITVDKGSDLLSKIETKEGYSWNQGAELHSYNTNYGLNIQNAKVLVTDNHIKFAQDILKLTNKLFEASGSNPINMPPLLIISPEISDEALSAIMGARKNGINLFHLKPEGIITERENCLLDIAKYTSSEFISIESGKRLDRLELDCLGNATSVMANKSHSLIVSDTQDTQERINLLKQLIKETKITGEKEVYKKSLARLTGGIVSLVIGGSTDTEKMELIDRIDDSIRATKAAKEDGYVLGGGVALLRCLNKVNNRIMYEAIHEPAKRILVNCDQFSKRILDKMINGSFRYDISVIDPFKVVKEALNNAVSVSSLILQTAAIITKE